MEQEQQKKPLISFIIPVLNEEKHLARTIRPLRQLEGLSAEIIVSDGGSSDNTVAIAGSLADKVNVRPAGEKNKSIGENRNKGAKLAEGEFLFFLDCDVSMPDLNACLKKCLKIFRDKEEIGAFTFKIQFYPNQQTWFDGLCLGVINFFHFFTNRPSFSFMAQSIGWAQFVRHDVFKQVGGYNENLIFGEDNNLYQKINRFKKTVYLPEFIVYGSPVRFRKYGWFKMGLLWLINTVWYFLFRKSFTKKWERIGS
jgi:glycosyltransferase involved in cell wall biosynthesis